MQCGNCADQNYTIQIAITSLTVGQRSVIRGWQWQIESACMEKF